MATLIHEMIAADFKPDLLTDQTSAHDPLNGYIPEGMTLEAAAELRKSNPKDYIARAVKKHGPSRARHAAHAGAGSDHV